jgi:hypothetical protein
MPRNLNPTVRSWIPPLVREGGAVHAQPLSLYLPSSTKLWYENTIQRRGQIHSPYFYSTPKCSLWNRLSQKGKKSDPSSHSWKLVTSYLQGRCGFKPESTHRVAMATFWRTFRHDGKISPSWWGWGGVHALPLSLYLPSSAKLWCTLQLRGQMIHSPYFYSTVLPLCTLWVTHHLQSERDSANMSMSNLISSRIFLWGCVMYQKSWGSETRQTKWESSVMK